jgi:iron(III) transport system permease protein
MLAGDPFVTTRRRTGAPAPLFEALRRSAARLITLVIGVAVVAPLAVLGREASGVASWRTIFAGSGDAIATSLVLSACSATVVVGIAVWLGYARARASRRLGQLTDVALVVLFAVPSTMVGVGLIGVWNRSGPVGVLYGTDGMFVLAHVSRFVPVAALALAAVVRYVPVSHEEAAAMSGAGWLRTVATIIAPQIRPGLAVAWVVVFVLAFGELGASILVAPPGESTLPIRIYTIIANTPPSHVATLALLQTTVILTPLALLGAAASLRVRR